MRRSNRHFLFIVLLVGLVLMRESRLPPLDGMETAFANWLAINAPRKSTEAAPLVLVQITDEDLKSAPWPWSPVDDSLVLNAALPFQPPVLAVEPVLDWAKPDKQELTLLHNQLLRAPKAVLAAELGFPEDPAMIEPRQEVPVLRHVEGDVSRVREFPHIAAQPAEALRLSAALGFVDAAGLAGKPVRRVPLVYRYGGQVVPSFVLQAAMLWFGMTAEDVTVVPGSHIAFGGELRVPVDATGAMLIDFTIPVIRFSAGDLILSAEQYQSGHQAIAPVAHLRNSLTLLARTDSDSRTLPLANGRDGSRGEVFAAALATIQKGSFIRRAGWGVDALLVFEAMILAWFCRRMSRPGVWALCIGLFCAYMLCSLNAMAAWNLALPLTVPAGLLALIAVYRQLD